MPRINANTYGHALGALVERHNSKPDDQKQRIAELEALVERQHIRELEAALADSPMPSVFGQAKLAQVGIPLKKWHKQNSMSYWKAYRLVSSGKLNAYQEGRNWFATRRARPVGKHARR